MKQMGAAGAAAILLNNSQRAIAALPAHSSTSTSGGATVYLRRILFERNVPANTTVDVPYIAKPNGGWRAPNDQEAATAIANSVTQWMVVQRIWKNTNTVKYSPPRRSLQGNYFDSVVPGINGGAPKRRFLFPAVPGNNGNGKICLLVKYLN